MTFDELRVARPALGLALYALDPGRGVTLEVYADGELFQFHGATADDAIRSAFPPVVSQTPPRAEWTALATEQSGEAAHKAAEAGGVAETTRGVFD